MEGRGGRGGGGREGRGGVEGGGGGRVVGRGPLPLPCHIRVQRMQPPDF